MVSPSMIDSVSCGPQGQFSTTHCISEGAARVAAHRLRSRYAELLRGEISRTVAGPAEMEAELAALRAALTN